MRETNRYRSGSRKGGKRDFEFAVAILIFLVTESYITHCTQWPNTFSISVWIRWRSIRNRSTHRLTFHPSNESNIYIYIQTIRIHIRFVHCFVVSDTNFYHSSLSLWYVHDGGWGTKDGSLLLAILQHSSWVKSCITIVSVFSINMPTMCLRMPDLIFIRHCLSSIWAGRESTRSGYIYIYIYGQESWFPLKAIMQFIGIYGNSMMCGRRQFIDNDER